MGEVRRTGSKSSVTALHMAYSRRNTHPPKSPEELRNNPLLLLKGMGKLEKAYEKLNAWVTEPHDAKERREEARLRIDSFLKNGSEDLDLAGLALTSLPPVFHLFRELHFVNMNLTGNPGLKDLPCSLFTLVKGRLKIDSPVEGIYWQLACIDFHVLRRVPPSDELPIKDIPKVLGYLPFEKLSLKHFPQSEPDKSLARLFVCVGRNDNFLVFGKNRNISAEKEIEIRNEIFPAAERDFKFIEKWISQPGFFQLYAFLGFHCCDIEGDGEGVVIVLPSIAYLQSRWEELRERVNIRLPQLNFQPCKGIASDAEFINAFLEGKILISLDEEFYHDMTAHVMTLFRFILSRARPHINVYENERSNFQNIVRSSYDRIQRAIANPELAGPDKVKLIQKRGEQILALLSAYVDFFTANDYIKESSFFESSELKKITDSMSYYLYFQRRFKDKWDINKLLAAFEAIKAIQ